VLLRLMAPILSFTAEEAWEVLHPGKGESVFFHTWNDVLPKGAGEADLAAKWSRLRAIRALVQKELEDLRQAGRVGSSLQGEAVVHAPAEERALLESLGDDLRFVLITSAARVQSGETLRVEVTPSAAPKCGRCWHYRVDVGSDTAHPALCGRCVASLFGAGEARLHA
jgi:isoleucyl-tRNA synthetase